MKNETKLTDATTDNAKVKVSDSILRPKTRGELLNALKENIKCEVIASNEEFTSLALQSLLIMKKDRLKFKTKPSENAGWVIYEAV